MLSVPSSESLGPHCKLPGLAWQSHKGGGLSWWQMLAVGPEPVGAHTGFCIQDLWSTHLPIHRCSKQDPTENH